jgi:CTP synthase
MAKYIFVTGGVTSSLGKGIISASLAKLLQEHGYSVTIQKFDPYINIDPGTLNPYEHGECFVTDDGAETDLDLGHYERFLNVPTSSANNVTSGKIYQTVIQNEREGKYLGKTVQVIPHITDEIKRRMLLLGETGKYEIIISEIGGTAGDIESLPFMESIRQLRWEMGSQNFMIIHLTLLPYLKAAKELKTKPTQHSVRDLQHVGLQPDILVCRTEHTIGENNRKKIAQFCNVQPNCVIEALDAQSIYDVPLLMLKEDLDDRVLQKLKLPRRQEVKLTAWRNFLGNLKNPTNEINIALVGKYVELQDAYKSIHEAILHAGVFNELKVNVQSVHSESINEENVEEKFSKIDGILVAPGFGNRGIEGKIQAIKYVRENRIPFFGICLGMQCAVIEYSRNVLGLADAHSTEMDAKTKYNVIDLMEAQKKVKNFGGTMRLGSYPCKLKKGSKAFTAYGTSIINERHRHRYELNNEYIEQLEKNGLIASGINTENNLVEIVEIKDHPFFVGVQFHPEYKSTVEKPHPLFVKFLKNVLERKIHQQEKKVNIKK